MKHWWQVATRNWWSKPGRNLLSISSIALGVAVVVWVTCCYESVRRGVTDVVLQWIGRSHVVIESSAGVWGNFSDDVVDLTDDIGGIAAVTTRTRDYIKATHHADQPMIDIEMSGVEPDKESTFRTHNIEEGRFLEKGDRGVIVIERLLAKEFDLNLGDKVYLQDDVKPKPLQAFEIIGIADRRRASVNQAMMVWLPLTDAQGIIREEGIIKAIDIIAADPTVANIQEIARQLRDKLKARDAKLEASESRKEELQVRTTAAQHKKLDAAKGLLRFIMMLLASVVLLTAFFIILSTMSMGVTERIAELGLMRCVGVTRGQVARVVLLQMLPLGLIGTAVGVPLGLWLQVITLDQVPQYLGEFAINRWGMTTAILGGIGASILGAAVPAISAFEVSPIEASRAGVGQATNRWLLLALGVGAVLIIGHFVMTAALPERGSGTFDVWSIAAIVLLYLGAAALTPVIIVLIARVVIAVVAAALALHRTLLGDEIIKAPIRAGAVCAALMVGLSMIVGLVVWGQSVKSGWEFPKEFPDALLYSYERKPLADVQALRDTEGVAEFTVTDDFGFHYVKPSKNRLIRMLSGSDPLARFLAIDPVEGLGMVKLTFLEGNLRDAQEKLLAGGHILVTREFARARDKHVGDRVRIWVANEKDDVDADDKYVPGTFTIAGVIASPGLDIAVSFFQAGTYFQSYAVGSVIGTLDDVKKLFGREFGKLVLFNFDLPEESRTRIDSDSSQVVGSGVKEFEGNDTGRKSFSMGRGPIPGDGPEEQIVNAMLKRLGFPPKAFVTARELKLKIDSSINSVTLLLSAIPFVGLFIAALGLGNLMAANVASRTRDLAVLRAVGVTRWQVLRMVLGEALVLALIGSGMGLGLGLLLGNASNRMTSALSGFEPEFAIPWGLVGLGAAAATVLCMLATLIPALRASRSNIVAALADG